MSNDFCPLIGAGGYKAYDVFLSHRYAETAEVEKLATWIHELGYSVYLDWKEDPQLDRSKVSPHTADVIRNRLRMSTCLIFAFSRSDTEPSVWMPWELGFFDGASGMRIGFLPLDEQARHTLKGQEYLGLYKELTYDERPGDPAVVPLKDFLQRNASPARLMDNVPAYFDWMAKMTMAMLRNPMNLPAGLLHWSLGEAKQWGDAWAQASGITNPFGAALERAKQEAEDLRVVIDIAENPGVRQWAPVIWGAWRKAMTVA